MQVTHPFGKGKVRYIDIYPTRVIIKGYDGLRREYRLDDRIKQTLDIDNPDEENNVEKGDF